MKVKKRHTPFWKKCMVFDLICACILIAAAGSQSFSYPDAAREANAAAKPLKQEEEKPEREEEPEKEQQEEKKKIALTFDDGPHPVYTPMMLEVLKEKNVKATFFLLGEQVEKYPEIVKQISEEGHLIGNHSYKHEQLSKLSVEQACAKVNRTNELIKSITGNSPEYIRPPFGDWKDKLDCQVNMIEVLWDVDTLDWSSQNKEKVIKKVVTKAEEGDIILMHDSYETTVTATAEIIDRLEKEGYEFVTVDELIFQ